MVHILRDRSVSAVSVLRDVAAVGVFVVNVCSFVLVAAFLFYAPRQRHD